MAAAVTYDIMIHAAVPTRFEVRHRWVIAGSFATEIEARDEYAALCREFPSERVSLILLTAGIAPHTGRPFERVLDTRGSAVPPERRRQAPVAKAAPEPAPPRPEVERPRVEDSAPAAASNSSPMIWALMAMLVCLSLLGTLLLVAR